MSIKKDTLILFRVFINWEKSDVIGWTAFHTTRGLLLINKCKRKLSESALILFASFPIIILSFRKLQKMERRNCLNLIRDDLWVFNIMVNRPDVIRYSILLNHTVPVILETDVPRTDQGDWTGDQMTLKLWGYEKTPSCQPAPFSMGSSKSQAF